MNNCFNRTEYYAYHAGHMIPMGSPHADVPEYTVYDSVAAASAGYTSSDQYIPTNKYVHTWLNNNFCVYGNTSNGKYLKYENGTLIVWKSVNITNLNIATPWGTLYEGGPIDLGYFPVNFYTAPNIYLTPVNANVAFESVKSTTTNHAGSVWAYRPTAATINGALELFAIGRWK